MAKTNAKDGVIVVGAGPVGCTTALMLSQAGIPVTLLEEAGELHEDMRASTFHPPTLDMLDKLGVTEKLLPQGLIASQYQYRDRISGNYAEFDIGVLDGIVKHPYRLQCEQFKMTRVIANDLLPKQASASIRMRTRLVELEQGNGGVVATVEGPDGKSKLEGRYIVGTDGARSLVRKQTGIEFEGFTYPELFLVVSTDHPLEKHFENLSYVNYVSDPQEWCTILRVPTQWRVLFPTDPNASAEELTDPEAIEARMQRLAPKAGRYNILHTSLYRIHQRVAKKYRNGNVLLAGDAAHLNNPLGGMGMNGGVHDAINLCEKLIPIMLDGASEDALDLYERQRRNVTVDFIQAQTVQNKKNIEEASEATRVERLEKLKAIARDREQAIAFLRGANMVDSVARSYAIT